jgi:hypothetical protein
VSETTDSRLGNIEGKLDLLIDMQKDTSKRVGVLETFKTRMLTANTLFGLGVATFITLAETGVINLKGLFHSA